ncbi:flagellin [Anaerovibrio slackiae]|nr:flagellin [Anaerovibrio slackiae]
MVIFNNMAAMSALNETNRNTSKLGKTIKQATSGMRLNSAGDDASGYSISERMRVKIRALGQCKENSAKGQDLIDTASAAVDQQVNIMKQVKTIALRATDSTYTDADRGNLQKELSQLLDQSEDIANTQFNGISLLNQKMVSETIKWFDADAPYKVNRNNIPVLKQAATGDYNVPQGEYVEITHSSVLYEPGTTPGSQLTVIPAAGNLVYDAGGNVHTVYADSTGHYRFDNDSGALIEVHGVANPPGSTNPSDVGTTTNVYDGILPQIHNPDTTLSVGDFVSDTPYYPGKSYRVEINPFTGKLSYFNTDTFNDYSYITEVDLSDLRSAIANVPEDLDGLGFSFDCGGCDQFVTVMFDASTSASNLYEGESGTPHPLCYVIGVKDVTDVPTLEASLGEAIFNGVNAVTQGAKGNSLPSSTDTSTTLADRHTIKLNYYADTGKLSITKKDSNLALIMKNGLMGEMKEDVGYKPEQNLYLHTDDKSSRNVKVSLPNTTLSMLFPAASSCWDIDPKEVDYPEEWPKGYDTLSDAEKKAKWKEEVWQYPNRKVKLDVDQCVSSRERANDFLADVDQAIKYLLNANTTLGAESSRLDYTQDNIVVMQENTTAAESVQRDADIAKVAMEQAKYNLLQQASQSMLAQANQSPNGVLSLLQ